MRIEFLNEVNSTNDYIRRYLDGGEDVLVCARTQTGGRGTKGRTFSSGAGGVYLTALVFYDGFPAHEAFRVMMRAALAVCKTAEEFALSPKIKWANDVFLNGKKLAGILIENFFSGDNIRASLVGIGMNVENDLTPIKDIAVSLSEAAGRRIDYSAGRDALVNNCKKYLFERKNQTRGDGTEEYKNYLLTGKAQITEGDCVYEATVTGVLPDGRLKIEKDGREIILSAAEIRFK